MAHFQTALKRLQEGTEKAASPAGLTELEEEGLIQRFEYTYELAWKTLQDLLKAQGYTGTLGPAPVLEQALKDGYYSDRAVWASMKEARNLSSHTYDEAVIQQILLQIRTEFMRAFTDLEAHLVQLRDAET